MKDIAQMTPNINMNEKKRELIHVYMYVCYVSIWEYNLNINTYIENFLSNLLLTLKIKYQYKSILLLLISYNNNFFQKLYIVIYSSFNLF